MIRWRSFRFFSLLALVPLAGCNTSASLKDVETACVGSATHYSDAWNCARNQYLSYDEYRARYLATGDALATQVDAGQVSDAAAKAALSSGFSGRGGGGRR